MKKVDKKAIAVIGLGALAAIGGTFAYYNQSVSLDNPLSTGNYENQLVEEFTPEADELKPGATINKDVGAINTGDYPVLVRVKMDEKWTRTDDDGTTEIISHSSIEEANYDASDTEKKNAFSAYEIDSETGEFITVDNEQVDADADDEKGGDEDGYVTDGSIQDISVVRKNLTESSNWVYGQDGYWYYKYVLEPSDDPDGSNYTGNLLDSITLASNIDLGCYEEHKYYLVADEGIKLDTLYNSDGSDLYTWYEYTPSETTETDDGNGGTVKTTTDFTYVDLTGTTVTLTDENGDGVTDEIDLAIAVIGENTDMSLYRRSVSAINPDLLGYSDANYTLTVTSYFVQATVNAVEDAWKIDDFGTYSDLVDYLNGLGMSIAYDSDDSTLLVSDRSAN